MKTNIRLWLAKTLAKTLFLVASVLPIAHAQLGVTYEDVVIGPPMQMGNSYGAATPWMQGACGELLGNVRQSLALMDKQSAWYTHKNPRFVPGCILNKRFEVWVDSGLQGGLQQASYWADASVVEACTEGAMVNGACVKRMYKDLSCKAGNPVSPGSGAKFHTETDYQGAGAHPLEFSRLYVSSYSGWSSMAKGWRHNWQRSLEVLPRATAANPPY